MYLCKFGVCSARPTAGNCTTIEGAVMYDKWERFCCCIAQTTRHTAVDQTDRPTADSSVICCRQVIRTVTDWAAGGRRKFVSVCLRTRKHPLNRFAVIWASTIVAYKIVSICTRPQLPCSPSLVPQAHARLAACCHTSRPERGGSRDSSLSVLRSHPRRLHVVRIARGLKVREGVWDAFWIHGRS